MQYLLKETIQNFTVDSDESNMGYRLVGRKNLMIYEKREYKG